MALQKPFADSFGNDNPKAYHKITQTNIDWNQKKAYVVLGIYKDKKAREENKQVIGAIETVFPLEIELDGDNGTKIKKEIPFDAFFGTKATGKNASEQSYLAFKELPAFKDSIDA